MPFPMTTAAGMDAVSVPTSIYNQHLGLSSLTAGLQTVEDVQGHMN